MATSRPAAPVPHERPAEGEAHELLGFERVLFWLRVVGLLVLVSQAPAYRLLDPLLVVAVVVLTGSTAVAQRLTLHEGMALRRIRRRSELFLVSDIAALAIAGAAFAPDPVWLAFYFYPLLPLEATLIAGTAVGVLVTVVMIAIYGAQLLLHVALGNAVEPREVVAAVAMLGLTGGSMAAFGHLVERGRRDLRVLLGLTSALAEQIDDAETVDLLDRRLRDAVGAGVRSIILRDAEGRFIVLRRGSWRGRRLSLAELESSLGPIDDLTARLAEGASSTHPTDPASRATPVLALPAWARSVTLVPIFTEGRWVGILPVVWPADKVPSRRELGLLYGLAGHLGLALTRGELHRARAAAATDPLTGLLNRRAIGDELASFVARASRSDGRMAILFCDLDGFKAVNDRHGHEAGDAVLIAVADAVRAALRQGDVVGRHGGDELLVIASNAGAGEARALAMRVRAAVRAGVADDGVDVTIGIAVYPDHGRSDAELLGAADQAMYRGKLRGPGQVVVAGEDGPDPADGAAPRT